MAGGRGSRNLLAAGLAGCVVVLSILSAVLVTIVAEQERWPGVLDGLRTRPFESAGVVTVAAAVVAALVVRHPARPSSVVLRPPPVVEPPGWVVGRPVEAGKVIAGLRRRSGGTVGITTVLHGAGGFGKTTLAEVVCADRRVLRRFRGRVYRVTVGRDVRGPAAVAAKVCEAVQAVTGDAPTIDDPRLAGQHLGRLLDELPRTLLFVDDVWEAEQLEPFLIGGRRCVRLVTTRVPGLLPGGAVRVPVDQMSPDQARQVLTWELPPLDESVTVGLLAATGRWPLLLRLVNRQLADAGRTGQSVSEAGRDVLGRLRAAGPGAADDPDLSAGLDPGDPAQRRRAVRTTIEAATSLLPRNGADRLAELGVFAEDESVPVDLVLLLWRASAGLDPAQGRRLCARMDELSLLRLDSARAVLSLHDVVRDFLRAELGEQRLAALNGALVDAVAATLPAARPLADGVPCAAVAWWELDDDQPYMWDYLVTHLLAAGRAEQADAVAGDLRWVGARLRRFGPVAPFTDLSQLPTGRAASLRAGLARAAHLLTPTDPARSVVDVLHSRLHDEPAWASQLLTARSALPWTGLVNRWPPPDLPDQTVRRVLTGHTDRVNAVAVAPDGSWIASGGDDGTVRVWDVATGRERARLTGHTGGVYAVAVAPDGSWIASGGDDQTVRVWDVATGRERARLTGHTHGVRAVAVAPDGSWIASGGSDQTVRVWDVATGQERARLTGHTDWVYAVAVAPDGSWIASGGSDQTVRVWDVATGQERARLTGHTDWVRAVAVAPDGSWIASGGDDQTVRVWDVATGQGRARLTGHTGAVLAVAVAPDGSWIASGSWDETVRVWDVATGQGRARLTGHTDWVYAVAVAPDGSWIASGGSDQTVRVWDVATGQGRARLTGHTDWVYAVAVAPDGSWIASGGSDQTVRVWDVATGQGRARLTGDAGPVLAVAVAPDGSWIASGGYDQTVRVWDVATGQGRARLTGHAGPVLAVAVAPDGSWIASGGSDQTVRVWDVATGQERARLTGHAGPVLAVAVAPDGSWIASGSSDETVRVWEVATGRERARLTGHAGAVLAVAVAPDGSWIASGSSDETVRVWEVATGRERARLTGHAGAVLAVAVAPDGSWIASGGDRTVRVWDAATGRCEATMRVDGTLTACAWSTGTGTIAAAGDQGVYLFDLRPRADQQ